MEDLRRREEDVTMLSKHVKNKANEKELQQLVMF